MDTTRNGTSSLNARGIRTNMRHTVERYLAGVDRAPQRNRIRTADIPHRGVASASNPYFFPSAPDLSEVSVSSLTHAFPLIETRGEAPEKNSFTSGCPLPESDFVEAYIPLRRQT